MTNSATFLASRPLSKRGQKSQGKDYTHTNYRGTATTMRLLSFSFNNFVVWILVITVVAVITPALKTYIRERAFLISDAFTFLVTCSTELSLCNISVIWYTPQTTAIWAYDWYVTWRKLEFAVWPYGKLSNQQVTTTSDLGGNNTWYLIWFLHCVSLYTSYGCVGQVLNEYSTQWYPDNSGHILSWVLNEYSVGTQHSHINKQRHVDGVRSSSWV